MGKEEDKRLFVILIPDIPQSGAWAARMNDGALVKEGMNGATWNNVNHGNVASYNVMGMAIPLGHECNFSRTGKASMGGQITPHTIVFSAKKAGVTIEFRFCKQKR